MIYDRFERPLLSARISITGKCNLDCIYCHKEGVFEDSADEMTPEEISRIIEILANNGIKKIKITGGEPLLRKDAPDIVGRISGLGIDDISMTTNGTHLRHFAEELKENGLKRINVSLDTLKSEVFSHITRGGGLERVLDGVDAAIDAGLYPVKLNMVVMRGINDGEMDEIMGRYSGSDVVLQLIELVNTDREFFERYYYSLDTVEGELEQKADAIRVRESMQGRKKYTMNGSQVEVIRPVHNTDFCAHCTRIRITADGKFKPCLMRADNTVDFLTPMRNGAGDIELQTLFENAVKQREPFSREV